MLRKTVSGIVFAMVLIGMLTLAFNIQQAKASGTIYIRADGSIDPPTAPIQRDGDVYTFTDNVNDSIVVERSNIIVDGADHTVQGSGSGDGIDLSYNTSNVTIKNMEIKAFFVGVSPYYSSNITLSGNKITDNYIGIYLFHSNYNIISRNNITDNGASGVRLERSSNNNISRNDIVDHVRGIWVHELSSRNIISGNNIRNNRNGIYLDESFNNILRSNNMTDNMYNFGVFGRGLSQYIHDIDASNTVDDKPLYYWTSKRDAAVPLDAGYVALVNCTHITVQKLNLTSNKQGILLAYTTSSTIAKNKVTNNWDGIDLWYSSQNNISGSNIKNNDNHGIKLDYSAYNVISQNKITANNGFNGYAIRLYGSSKNNISRNNIIDNYGGINVDTNSNNNSVYHNNFLRNPNQIYIKWTVNVVNIWDNGYPSGGNYWSDYTDVDLFSGLYQNETGSDGIGDTPYIIDENNTDNYPLMRPYPCYSHDIGITNIKTQKTIIGQGYTINNNITLLNYGKHTETFNVTVYYNETATTLPNGKNHTTITLTSGNSTTVIFNWNTTGVAKGNYMISAYVTPVPNETDTTDNTLVADEEVCVTIPGDVDADFDVDLYDAVKLLKIYGAKKDNPSYDANCDIDGDGDIDLYDAVLLLTHYGEKYP